MLEHIKKKYAIWSLYRQVKTNEEKFHADGTTVFGHMSIECFNADNVDETSSFFAQIPPGIKEQTQIKADDQNTVQKGAFWKYVKEGGFGGIVRPLKDDLFFSMLINTNYEGVYYTLVTLFHPQKKKVVYALIKDTVPWEASLPWAQGGKSVGGCGCGLSMQFGGQETDMEGNWKDHEIVKGNPRFVGYDKIDLKNSGSFWIRFAYPVDAQIMVVQPGKMGDQDVFPIRKIHFRKGQLWRWSPEKAAAYGAYPHVSEIWLVVQSRQQY